MFERRSGQFGSQAITKALSIQRRSNSLLSIPQKQFATLITNLPSATQLVTPTSEAVRHSDHKPA